MQKTIRLLFSFYKNFAFASLTLSVSFSLKRIFQDFNLEFDLFEKAFPAFSFKYNFKLSSLSVGERMLLEVYMVIRAKTQFVILDEPFSHIMPLHIEKIQEILLEEKQNKGILISDHMFRQITDISDDLYVLKDGKTHLTKSLNEIEELGYARI
jgi:lipopolysaccharide export system ATP-binding protein